MYNATNPSKARGEEGGIEQQFVQLLSLSVTWPDVCDLACLCAYICLCVLLLTAAERENRSLSPVAKHSFSHQFNACGKTSFAD